MNALAKLALLAIIVGFSAFAAIVGDAASAGEAGEKALKAARAAPSPAARLRMIDLAIGRIEESRSRPLQWHAGAAEMLAALYASRYDLTRDQIALVRSAYWSAHTVKLARVQPNAWTRLAHLALAGVGNDICEAAACVATSFEVARMQEAESACARLQVAARIEPINASDQRVRDFIVTARSRRQLARCLSFLPQRELFGLLLSAE